MSLANETFTDSVRRYCLWHESDMHDVESARQLLLALMQGIPYLTLSDISPDVPDFPRRGYEGWRLDCERLSDFPLRLYGMLFDPCDVDAGNLVVGDICDDLADIYGELWHGLQAMEKGYGAYAVNHWRDSYFGHWGRHAASGVYAIDAYHRKLEFG